MKIIGTKRFSSITYIAYLAVTSIAFGSLLVTPHLSFAQDEVSETFFEAAVREAGQTTTTSPAPAEEAAPAPAEEAAPAPAEEAAPAPAEEAAPAPAEEAAPAPAEEAAAPPTPEPSPAEQQNQTESQNPFEQLAEAISNLFGGN
jgi:uncharacterized membrane protein